MKNIVHKFLELFEENPETKRERLAREERLKEESKLNNYLSKVRFFSGSQKEYEEFIGYPVKIIDLGQKSIDISFEKEGTKPYTSLINFDLKKKLVEEKVEALINCKSSFRYESRGHILRGGYIQVPCYKNKGLPVKKVNL